MMRAARMNASPHTLVWDWPLRACHWSLVACVAGAWATHYAGLEWFDWHRRLGYATLVLVTFRVVWGFAGPRHARFRSFVRGPSAIAAYLRAGGGEATTGHSPLGALSVLAWLAVLLVQALTGLFANDEIANVGPFFGWVAPETSNLLTGWHGLNSNVVLGLVVLHLAAVGVHEWRGRRLVRAMVTGRKRVPDGEGIERSRGALALVIVAVLAAALALAVRAAPEATLSYF
jgi:cytochrome b